MTANKLPTPDTITLSTFNDLLSQYPQVVDSISASKTAKPGQKTLSDLDQYRYVEAPDLFGGEKSKREMKLDDVKKLVEWKLRHGKFRPTLMNLVSSNDPSTTSTTIQKALSTYHSTNSTTSPENPIPSTIETLCQLRGIGPATASLLLSVHAPQEVIFFSDEAFWWLCCGGRKAESIKYTAKEYRALLDEAGTLMGRLRDGGGGGVGATEVEKVAYVIMKRGVDGDNGGGTEVKPTKAAAAKTKKEVKPEKPKKGQAVDKKAAGGTDPKPVSSAKRKSEPNTNTEDGVGPRRSKRNKS